MTAYTREILVTLIKGPVHKNWIQPDKPVNSEALCYKMYPLDAETQAGQVVAPGSDPVLWAVSAAGVGISQQWLPEFLHSEEHLRIQDRKNFNISAGI